MLQLPIDTYLNQIIEKIFLDPPLILTASPGSGKTTRVPAKLLEALQKQKNNRKIIVIVPKRLAAVSAADRIAKENNWELGIDVGYQVRFETKCHPQTQLIFMTEGLFLKKVQDSDFWNDIGFIFLDEFHERSSHLDLILGLSFERKILESNLQIIIMSATLNSEKLKAYFKNFNFIEIQQRPYQLKTIYQKKSQSLICDSFFYENLKSAALAASKIAQKDLLIFLPGYPEILKAQNILKPLFPTTHIEFIYGGMTLSEQNRILNKIQTDRRILLATNIAESSLTIPYVDCVIDSGLEKCISYEKKMGFSKLETIRISQFSATQRAGRAARTSDGYCFKLWHEIDDRSLPEQKKPEILSADLTDILLVLAKLGHTDFRNFSWLDRPSADKLFASTEKLKTWELISSQNEVTQKGQFISKVPLDLSQAILFYELCANGHSAKACDLFSKLETIDSTQRAKFNPYDLSSDLDYIFQLSPNEYQKKMNGQLLAISRKVRAHQSTDFHFTLLEVFAKYFPERICLKKQNFTALSASGRGIEISDCSSLLSEKIPNDYFIALAGFEKSASQTTIQLGHGFSREQATTVLQKYLQTEVKVEYKIESQKFMKKTVSQFHQFVFSETSSETLSEIELSQSWQKFVCATPSVFLKLNSSYEKLTIKLHFLKSKCEILNLNSSEFDFLANFDSLFAKKIIDLITDFQDFLTCDFIFYVQDVISANIKNYVTELADSIQLPTGRTVQIDYTDPKAPMISARIQDLFRWSQTPKILNNKIPFTIQLLAPNMRPAQITNDLNNFWLNSYKDVRKDLRARYPKHHWPENPLEHRDDS